MAGLKTREAMHYKKSEDGEARCLLCPHYCVLRAGETGKCRARGNQGGRLIATNYGRSIGINRDPIEKKPLYHFRPGSRIVSLGPNSCNLSCFYCQNFSSSQMDCATEEITPEELAETIRRLTPKGPKQVAFTYTEPLTWYEFIYDFSQIAGDIEIVLVTNGYINPKPLEQLLPAVRALNIDLKGIEPGFYKQHCGAALPPVQASIKACHAAGKHVEVTNLLIPGLNDSERQVRGLAEFLASVNENIPLHISAYHPAFKSQIPATPAERVIQAAEFAAESLCYVYAGNIRNREWQATFCPQCGREVIDAERSRTGLSQAGSCGSCGHRIYGVF